jgi:mycoredoxin
MTISSEPAPSNTITVYWRPGCGFCAALRRDLDRAGLAYDEINIWEHPDAAAFVRSVANGNETVPTVTVGSVSVVNPSVDEVADLLQTAAG